MLEEYKNIYKENANLVKDWEHMTRSELAKKYLELNKTNSILAESYLSGLIYKYWNVMEYQYNLKNSNKVASEHDVYSWTLNSILYCLDKQVWNNPENILYNSENGPEKAINVRITYQRMNFYYLSGMQKRFIDCHASTSLEKISENSSDQYFLPYFENFSLINHYMYDRIRMCFENKDYFQAFSLDAILNYDVFDDNTFSEKKLKRHLKTLDEDYCEIFSNVYDVKFEDVKKSLHYITDVKSNKIQDKIQNLIKILRRDSELKDYIL